MAAAGDVYQLIDFQLVDGQIVENTYFYRNGDVIAYSAHDLADSYIGQVLPQVVAAQDESVLHTEIRVTNLYDDTDDWSESISVPGSGSSGDASPIFNAVGFSLVQDNGSVKNGAKRYVGLADSLQTNGVIDDATFLAILSTLSAALTGTLDVGILAVWLPIIVKRILVGPGDYRLPANSGETVYGAITDAILKVFVTSQTSRKIGVGA